MSGEVDRHRETGLMGEMEPELRSAERPLRDDGSMAGSAEKKLHEGFDAIHAPETLKARTLAAIEAQRPQHASAMSRREGETDAFHAKDPVADAGRVPDAVGSPAGSDSVSAQESARPSSSAGARADSRCDARFASRSATSRKPPRAKRSRRGAWRAKVAVAACLLLAVFGVGGFAVATPTAYVGLDVNPSVELGINRFDRVVSTEAYNADGEAALAAANVWGKTYEEAVALLQAEFGDALADDAIVEVSIVCDNAEQSAAIESASVACFGAAGQGVGGAHCVRETSEARQAASDAGMGMGKYRMYEALQEAGVEITAEECAAMSMRELRALVADAGAAIDETGCGMHEGSQQGSGYGEGQGQGNGARQGSGEGQGQGDGAEQGSGGGQGAGQGRGEGGQGQGHGFGGGNG